MAFVFLGTDHASCNPASSISLTPNATFGAFYVAVYAFQGVAAGSGPWIKPFTPGDPHNVIGTLTGWKQVIQQAPSGTGTGIEVWCAINGGSGNRVANFVSSSICVATIAAYTGAYSPTGSINDGAVRVATSAQVTGNTPAAPSVTANANELVVPIGGDQMTTPGFGTPAGYTVRLDNHDLGFGSVENVIADAVAAVTGATGAITFPGNAATVGTLGTTATLAVQPVPSTVGVSGAVLDFSYPVT